MGTNRGLDRSVLLLLVIVIVSIGLFFYRIDRSMRSLARPLQQLQERFEKGVNPNPTPTIVAEPVAIVRQVRSLSRLETACYTVEQVITAETKQGAFSFLVGDRLILIAHGKVIAGIDLRKLDEDDVIVGKDDTVNITLPEAEVFVTTLDTEKTRVYRRETGVFGMSVDLETDARQAAEEKILNAALEDGILEMAQNDAKSYVRSLILSLGFERVRVKY